MGRFNRSFWLDVCRWAFVLGVFVSIFVPTFRSNALVLGVAIIVAGQMKAEAEEDRRA